MEADQETRRLSQKVGATIRDLPELGQGVGNLGIGELAVAGMPPRRTAQPGHDEPVGVGSGAILLHAVRIEHGYDKSKPVSLVFCDDTALGMPT